MIETKERKIGDCVYSVTQLPARRALRLKTRLIKIFGPSLTQLLLTATEPQEKLFEEMNDKEKLHFHSTSSVDKINIQEIRKSSVVKGIQLLSESIEEKVFEDLVMELFQGVRKDGVEIQSGTFDMTFAGKLMEMYQVIMFILEVNYSDFFFLGSIGNLS